MFTTEALKKSLPAWYTSVDINTGDDLDDDPALIESWLSGDIETVNEAVNEMYFETRCHNQDEALRECTESLGLGSVDDLDDRDRESLVCMLDEIDNADPLTALLRNTHTWLYWEIPVDLAELARAMSPHAAFGDTIDDDGLAARTNALKIALRRVGIAAADRTEEVQATIIPGDGPYNWYSELLHVRVLWYGSPLDLQVPETGSKKVVVPDAMVLVTDTWNGNGNEFWARANACFEVDADNPVHVDGLHDSSWDDICGLVSSHYAREPRVVDSFWGHMFLDPKPAKKNA